MQVADNFGTQLHVIFPVLHRTNTPSSRGGGTNVRKAKIFCVKNAIKKEPT